MKSQAIGHRVMLVSGIGESFLAEHIKTFEKALPENIKLAYLPNYGLLRLRLTGISDSASQLEDILDQHFAALKKLVSAWMVADEDITLQEMVGRILTAKQKTLGTAESCTGGYIAHLITTIPGSSNYFKGSVISYDNEIKENLLGVDHNTLEIDGAVSESTVRQMVEGALEELGTDYAVASSGIMGPSGGTEAKPVGTVWIATGDRQRVVAQKFFFRFDRIRNIELTSNAALNLLRKFILGELP
jgi:nicotinamide-nucleotide amidase